MRLGQAGRVTGALPGVDRQLLVRVEDAEAGAPLGPVDSPLRGHAAQLVVVPLLHQRGVALKVFTNEKQVFRELTNEKLLLPVDS